MVQGEARGYSSMNGAVFNLSLLDKFRIQGDQIRGGNGDQGLIFLKSISTESSADYSVSRACGFTLSFRLATTPMPFPGNLAIRRPSISTPRPSTHSRKSAWACSNMAGCRLWTMWGVVCVCGGLTLRPINAGRCRNIRPQGGC